ncbi:MAG: helix-turn-helix domain-containing protein [Pseudomonadota bacterium]|nr:MAG: helix-turn-helix domain-containing protein [Pseudomonadota bacterium]
MQEHRSYLTRGEVARLFEVAPNTVSRWVRKGKLPSVCTPGGRRRYPVEPIMQLVQQFREGLDVSEASSQRGGERPALETDAGRAERS